MGWLRRLHGNVSAGFISGLSFHVKKWECCWKIEKAIVYGLGNWRSERLEVQFLKRVPLRVVAPNVRDHFLRSLNRSSHRTHHGSYLFWRRFKETNRENTLVVLIFFLVVNASPVHEEASNTVRVIPDRLVLCGSRLPAVVPHALINGQLGSSAMKIGALFRTPTPTPPDSSFYERNRRARKIQKTFRVLLLLLSVSWVVPLGKIRLTALIAPPNGEYLTVWLSQISYSRRCCAARRSTFVLRKEKKKVFLCENVACSQRLWCSHQYG